MTLHFFTENLLLAASVPSPGPLGAVGPSCRCMALLWSRARAFFLAISNLSSGVNASRLFCDRKRSRSRAASLCSRRRFLLLNFSFSLFASIASSDITEEGAVDAVVLLKLFSGSSASILVVTASVGGSRSGFPRSSPPFASRGFPSLDVDASRPSFDTHVRLASRVAPLIFFAVHPRARRGATLRSPRPGMRARDRNRVSSVATTVRASDLVGPRRVGTTRARAY